MNKHTKKVFLGGTCNESTWRDELIPKLHIDHFNPVVIDWDAAAMKEELKQREECDFCLYVITSEMTGVYSIAEVIDDSNKRPDKTIFAFKDIGFADHQIKSLQNVGRMVVENGGYYTNFDNISDYLNSRK